MPISPYFRFAQPDDQATVASNAESHVVTVLVGTSAADGTLKLFEKNSRGVETDLAATQHGNSLQQLAWKPTQAGTYQLIARSTATPPQAPDGIITINVV